MKITEIQVWDFCPAFRDGPYVMSHVTLDTAYGRILRVHTADGPRGLGEIVFAPSTTAADRRQRKAEERAFLPRLIGQDIEAMADFIGDLQGHGLSWHGVAFGLETAYLDLRARTQGRSVTDLLGGAKSDGVEDYFSVSERSAPRIRGRLAIAGPDRAVIQLKLGIGSLEEDHAQIVAALDVMSARQTLLADANGGWSPAEALSLIGRFDDPRLLWEEPCGSYEDNVAVAAESEKPVMLDQCIGDLTKALRAIEDGVAAAICIKPAFLGGLTAARQVRDRCAEAGLRMRIDGPWCGDIASASILSLALGAPPDLLIAGCDLREPLIIEPDLSGVVARPGARIAPPPGPGLGIEWAGEGLERPEAVYR